MQGKVACVTSAGSGIRQALAERPGCEGAKLVFDYVGSVDGAKQTERVIEQSGGAGEIVQADITRAGDSAYVTCTVFVVDRGLMRHYRGQ